MAKILTQLSVHMENRPGALAELTEALTEAGVNPRHRRSRHRRIRHGPGASGKNP